MNEETNNYTLCQTCQALRHEDSYCHECKCKLMTNQMRTEMKADVFAIMCEIAEGIIKHYKSDLYHDARYLENRCDFSQPVFWSVGACGTHIGQGYERIEDVLWIHSYGHYKHYKIYIDDRERLGFAFVNVKTKEAS